MNTRLQFTALVRPALLCAGALLCAVHLNAAADASREFTLKVLPLLKEKCFACHGDDAKKIKGELNLLTREGMLKGGENSQKVLIPGKAEESDLYISITWKNSDLEMPPKENDRLNPEQIELDPKEPLKLRVFIDRSIIEVFVNGRQCITVRAYPDRKDSIGVSLRSQGKDAKLVSLNAWQMKSIYQ